MEKHHISELDAALMIAGEIDAQRLRYQWGDDYVPEMSDDGNRVAAAMPQPAVPAEAHRPAVPQDGDVIPELLQDNSDEPAPLQAAEDDHPREPVLSLLKQANAETADGRHDGGVLPEHDEGETGEPGTPDAAAAVVPSCSETRPGETQDDSAVLPPTGAQPEPVADAPVAVMETIERTDGEPPRPQETPIPTRQEES